MLNFKQFASFALSCLFAGLGAATAQTPTPVPYSKFANVPIVGGGYVNGIYFTNTANWIYATTDVGGVYKSTGSTVSWIPLLDGLSAALGGAPGSVGVDAFAVDPTTPSNIYATTGWSTNGQIIYSWHSGQTGYWKPGTIYDSNNHVLSGITTGAGDNGRDAGPRMVVDNNRNAHILLGTDQTAYSILRTQDKTGTRPLYMGTCRQIHLVMG